MGKGHRTGRLAEEIRRIVSAQLLTEIKDPRLAGQMISITGVDVTSDGSYATCYVTVLGNDLIEDDERKQELQDEVLAGLKSASGKLRSEIGRQIQIRHIPELIFKIDTSMEYGRRIEQVISELKKNDGK